MKIKNYSLIAYSFIILTVLLLPNTSSAALFDGGGEEESSIYPSAAISLSDFIIERGESSTIEWTSTDADKCVGSGFNTSNRTSGSYAVSPSSTTEYSVTCTGTVTEFVGNRPITEEVSVSNSVRLVVTIPPSVTLSSDTVSIVSGESATLSWVSENAGVSCTGSGDGFSTGGALSGSDTVSPSSNTTYSISCSNEYTQEWNYTDKNYTKICTGGDNTTSLVTGTFCENNEPPSNSCGDYTIGDTCKVALQGEDCLNADTSPDGLNHVVYGYIYTFACQSATPTITTDSISISVSDPLSAPTASLNASPSSITRLESSTLSWSSDGATKCTGSGFNTSNRTSGSYAVSPSSTTSYSVTCEGAGGDSSPATADIEVFQFPTAIVGVSPSSIDIGDPTTISWSSTNASSCTGTNFSTGGATSGSISASPTLNITYSVSCTGDGGSASDSTEIIVNQSVSASISATPGSIKVGNSSKITWSSENATTCTGTNFSTGGATENTGSGVSVSPTTNTTYSVECSNEGSSTTSNVDVTISQNPTATLEFSPSPITAGTDVTLTWSSTNASSCTGTNFSTGGATSGSTTVNPSVTVLYRVTCDGVGASSTVEISADQTVIVLNPNASISAVSTRVIEGTDTTLSWSASDVNSCSILDPSGTVVASGTSGTLRTEEIGGESTYTISCSSIAGTITDTVTISPLTPTFEEF